MVANVYLFIFHLRQFNIDSKNECCCGSVTKKHQEE